MVAIREHYHDDYSLEAKCVSAVPFYNCVSCVKLVSGCERFITRAACLLQITNCSVFSCQRLEQERYKIEFFIISSQLQKLRKSLQQFQQQ